MIEREKKDNITNDFIVIDYKYKNIFLSSLNNKYIYMQYN